MKRRSFLHAMGGAAGATMLGTVAAADAPAAEAAPRRPLGKTGLNIFPAGFPGLALIHTEQDGATEVLHRAVDQGVNYFDVAPAYGNGDAELKMGIGLEGIPRDKYYLACKTQKRDKEGARAELERSLERLKTDHFDVYQLHCLRTREEVQEALGPSGAMETILQAKEEGKVRFIGFSAHTWYSAVEAIEAFDFDTVMFPINFVEMLTWGFGRAVLRAAAAKQMGVLAIKALSRGAWPEGVERTRKWWYRAMETDDEVRMAMRYTLSQEGVAAGFSPSFVDLFWKSVDAARTFQPVSDAEVEKLRAIAGEAPALFKRENEQFAHAGAVDQLIWPDSPHEAQRTMQA